MTMVLPNMFANIQHDAAAGFSPPHLACKLTDFGPFQVFLPFSDLFCRGIGAASVG